MTSLSAAKARVPSSAAVAAIAMMSFFMRPRHRPLVREQNREGWGQSPRDIVAGPRACNRWGTEISNVCLANHQRFAVKRYQSRLRVLAEMLKPSISRPLLRPIADSTGPTPRGMPPSPRPTYRPPRRSGHSTPRGRLCVHRHSSGAAHAVNAPTLRP